MFPLTFPTVLRYIEFKKIYYFAVAYLYLGVQADESQRMGERVTYFQVRTSKKN